MVIQATALQCCKASSASVVAGGPISEEKGHSELSDRLRCVNIRGKILSIPDESFSPSADQSLEEIRAERKLAEMDLYEDLAELHDTEDVPGLREKFANWYRRLIGVLPSQRQEFRRVMEGIVAGGNRPVADVIDFFGRDHEKGSASADGGSA